MSQLNIQYELRVLLTDHIKELRRMMPEADDHSSHLVEQSSDEEVDTRRQQRSQRRVNDDVISPEVDNLINRQNSSCQQNYNTPLNRVSDDTMKQMMMMMMMMSL